MNDIEARADGLLQELSRLSGHLAVLEQDFNQRIFELKSRYEQLADPLRREFEARERELEGLMKRNRSVLFDGQDQVNLPHGILLYGEEPHVVIPRDAVARLEAAGLWKAIKVAKSVDRAAVERLSDEELDMLGMERKLMQTYTYELSGAGARRKEKCNAA